MIKTAGIYLGMHVGYAGWLSILVEILPIGRAIEKFNPDDRGEDFNCKGSNNAKPLPHSPEYTVPLR
jgi:hypothetical protein